MASFSPLLLPWTSVTWVALRPSPGAQGGFTMEKTVVHQDRWGPAGKTEHIISSCPPGEANCITQGRVRGPFWSLTPHIGIYAPTHVVNFGRKFPVLYMGDR